MKDEARAALDLIIVASSVVALFACFGSSSGLEVEIVVSAADEEP